MRSWSGLAALALVAGCSSITGTGPAPSPAPTAHQALGDAAPSAAPTLVSEAGFRTPSGNIGCYLTRSQVRCDIAAKAWTPPSRPADCELDYGSGLTLGREVSFVCAGDTVLGARQTLSYGSAIQSGDVRCDSGETALRCANVATNHGFTLAREQYHFW
ncbi:DUF6636 domain-containing protein [Actinoplanes sp. N902-109]|uniref:DUF6636 domain-containing protein n=1 Tax=Actinoplanes sp. (strain N902-109) TaxID=649831 RepID=UPI0003294BFD|nr:DUF6636 domain-containing protein [Actinoplanes sp. N902-109]AGL20371.1 hypothetical protein L083_6861 [Actinoplanes sp. N902-109]